ncbi:hypothetical protein RSPO_c00312 [Ralstonia solanacearum Po82]|uniref:Uncharacterized protein n=1 Tax=Ralstonia solanacearum (strain Po82) TaxID=1031711 RepID=F6G6S0_RALS8|nr:hypothetical protein RSPO_c00312 [Ralstonia solanacearum Po82]
MITRDRQPSRPEATDLRHMIAERYEGIGRRGARCRSCGGQRSDRGPRPGGGRTAITEISGANDPSQPLHRMRRHSGLRAVFNDRLQATLSRHTALCGFMPGEEVVLECEAGCETRRLGHRATVAALMRIRWSGFSTHWPTAIGTVGQTRLAALHGVGSHHGIDPTLHHNPTWVSGPRCLRR